MNKRVVVLCLVALIVNQPYILWPKFEFSALSSTLLINTCTKINNSAGGMVIDGGTLEFAPESSSFIGGTIIQTARHPVCLRGLTMPLEHTTIWKNTPEIALDALCLWFSSDKCDDACWIFEPTEECAHVYLHGTETVFDLCASTQKKGTPRIIVKAGMTLHLSHIKIIGLGSWHGHIEVEKGAQIVFSDVEIELASPYVVEQGTWKFDGPATVFTNQWCLLFRDEGKMIIAGTTVWDNDGGCDPVSHDGVKSLQGIDCSTNVLLEEGSKNKQKGRCCKLISGGAKNHVEDDQLLLLQENCVLSADRHVHATSKICVKEGCEVILDGAGYNLCLSGQSDIITVACGATLVLENITLRNFHPCSIVLEPKKHHHERGSLIFGRNVKIELEMGNDERCDEICSGIKLCNSLIIDMSKGNQKLPARFICDGMGNTLSLENVCPAIVIRSCDSPSTVCFRRIRLLGLGGFSGTDEQNFVIGDPSITVIFEDATLHLMRDFLYCKGVIAFCRSNHLEGSGRAFINASCQPCTVLPNSSLYVAPGMTFKYVGSSLHGLCLADQTSSCTFDGSVLDVTGSDAGMCFTQGHLIIDNHAVFRSERNVACKGITFDPKNVVIDVLAAGVLEVDGYLGAVK